MKTVTLLTILLTTFISRGAEAKPLSYVGGTMAMQENDETGHTLSVDYTFDPHFALGLYSKDEINQDEFWMVGPQLNTLLKRWNLPDGQGNLFLMTGGGEARQGNRDEPAAWLTFLGDYETRRAFFSYESRFVYARGIEKSVWQRAYAGFAPYLADYEQLNTWLLLRVDHHPAKHDHFVVTPVIRFFYKTIWLEAGYSSNNHVMVNWTMQF
ncbi:MAG TPA: hypothetical protein VJU77_00585 [Chthoniobacterales bacterium]|nr:hypothetical protein [Chthoniobacterales bacterium]